MIIHVAELPETPQEGRPLLAAHPGRSPCAAAPGATEARGRAVPASHTAAARPLDR